MNRLDRSSPKGVEPQRGHSTRSLKGSALLFSLLIGLLMACEPEPGSATPASEEARVQDREIPSPISDRVPQTLSHRRDRSLSYFAVADSDLDIHKKWSEITKEDDLRLKRSSQSEHDIFLGGLKRPPHEDKFLTDAENQELKTLHELAKQRLIDTNWVIPVRAWLVDYNANTEVALISTPLKKQINMPPGSGYRSGRVEPCGQSESARFELNFVNFREERDTLRNPLNPNFFADVISFKNILNRMGFENASAGPDKKDQDSKTLLPADYPYGGLVAQIDLEADVARVLSAQTENWQPPQFFVAPRELAFAKPWWRKPPEPYLSWQVGLTLEDGQARFGSGRCNVLDEDSHVRRAAVGADLTYLALTLIEPPNERNAHASNVPAQADLPVTRVLWSYRSDNYTEDMLEADLREYLVLYGYIPEDSFDGPSYQVMELAKQYAADHQIQFRHDFDPAALIALMANSFDLRAWMFVHGGDAGDDFNQRQRKGLKELVLTQLGPN